MSRKFNLIKQFVTLLILVILVVLVVRWCNRKEDAGKWTIENTPIRVEMIRNIAEIATVSYKDEVVVDSVEYYKTTQEQIAGNLLKLSNPKEFRYGIRSSAVKRRVTILVRGEVRYGFDLSNSPIEIQETDSLVKILLPDPKIVDLQVTPSSTEVFQEHGDWKDYEITQLHNKARKKLIMGAEHLKLQEKSKENIIRILNQLIRTNKEVVILFD